MNYTYEYPRAANSADIAVFRKHESDLQVLLILRRNPPHKGMWALPGGFMEIDESLEETASRELEEETGLKNIPLHQFRTFSKVDRDPRTRVVTTVFYGYAQPGNDVVKGSDDAEEAVWYSVSDLPGLGFDHDRIIELILEKFSRENL